MVPLPPSFPFHVLPPHPATGVGPGSKQGRWGLRGGAPLQERMAGDAKLIPLPTYIECPPKAKFTFQLACIYIYFLKQKYTENGY